MLFPLPKRSVECLYHKKPNKLSVLSFDLGSLTFGDFLKQISLVEACEYGFGGEESDLFKAPEPIIMEEPMLAVDPLSQEIVGLSDLGSLQSDQQLIEKAFYECEQEELLVKSAMESPLLSDVLDSKNVSLAAEMDSSGVVVSDVAVPKSVSSGNLRSMDMPQQQQEDAVIQRFFPPVDNGMRRAFSESDIQVRTKVINTTFLNIKLNLYRVFTRLWSCVLLWNH